MFHSKFNSMLIVTLIYLLIMFVIFKDNVSGHEYSCKCFQRFSHNFKSISRLCMYLKFKINVVSKSIMSIYEDLIYMSSDL